MEKLLKILKDLSNITSNPGSETSITNFIVKNLLKYKSLEWDYNSLGNLIIRKKSKNKKAKNLLIDAHIDEVGFIATEINNKGFIGIEPKGGVSFDFLPNTKVNLIINSKKLVPGYIFSIPPHLSQNQKMISKKHLVDFGFSSKEEAFKEGFKIGQEVSWANEFWLTKNRVFSRGLDNKIGVAVLINLLETINKENFTYNLFICFSVQEEVGLRGAKVNSQSINPDLAIVIDTSPASDLFKFKNENDSLNFLGYLDKGPFLRYMDRGYISPKKIVSFISKIAKDNNINLQPYISYGGTNANEISLQGEGTKVIQLGCVARNIHSPISSASISDIENLSNLLSLILLNINKI